MHQQANVEFCYDFSPSMRRAIKQLWESADVLSEQVTSNHGSVVKQRYWFIRFKHSCILPFEENDYGELLTRMFAGADAFFRRCLANVQSVGTVGAFIESGFRWRGHYDEKRAEKTIEITGYAVQITHPHDVSEPDYRHLLTILCQALKTEGFIDCDSEHQIKIMSSVAMEPLHHEWLSKPSFFKKHQLDRRPIRPYIHQHIALKSAGYVRSNEKNINPCYQAIEDGVDPLHINQKKIWLLRSDFILAIGNKHAYWMQFNATGLSEAIEASLHRYVDWSDRYGHPSLAITHSGYDGTAFYGGYLAQRASCIELYLFSGRYHDTNPLAEEPRRILESYIAEQFQQAYGEQPVVFIDAVALLDNFELSFFLNDDPLPSYCPRRTYTSDEVERTLNQMAFTT